jgi:hypothetical protein
MARIGAAAMGVGRGRKVSSSSEAAVDSAELVAPHSIPSRTFGSSSVTAGYETRVQMSTNERCRRSRLGASEGERCNGRCSRASLLLLTVVVCVFLCLLCALRCVVTVVTLLPPSPPLGPPPASMVIGMLHGHGHGACPDAMDE